jgi:hypothetical protein
MSFHGHFRRYYAPDHCMGSDDESEDDKEYDQKLKKMRGFCQQSDAMRDDKNFLKHKFSVKDIPEPKYIISKKRMKSFCAQCGKTKTSLKRYNKQKSYYSVCVGGQCENKFIRAPFASSWKWYDLRQGIPYIMVTGSRRDTKIRDLYCCNIPSPMREEVFMVCAYCGNKNVSEVVAHPRVPKHYRWNVFCKNRICFLRFINYSDSLERLRNYKNIPSAIFNDTAAALDCINEKTGGLDLLDFLGCLYLASKVERKHPSVVEAAEVRRRRKEEEEDSQCMNQLGLLCYTMNISDNTPDPDAEAEKRRYFKQKKHNHNRTRITLIGDKMVASALPSSSLATAAKAEMS